MAHSNVVTLCLVAAALLLFLYTFTERAEPQSQPRVEQPHAASRLAAAPSTNSAPLAPPAPIVSPTVPPPALLDPRVAALYAQQAGQRKSMFEGALAKAAPSVSDVLLPIVEEAYCPSLVRIGSVGDGGKWVCNPWAMPKGGVVFSLGSNNDISFESDYQAATGKAATIISVDMDAASVRTRAGLYLLNAQFVQAKIAEETNLQESPPHYTVADLMKKMGHEHIEILKMDIEGAEFTVLPQFLKGNSVCQIMVEIHAIAQVPTLLRAVANAGFLLQKYELNAYWTGTGLCEYSFIHESCLEKYGATLLASYLKQ